MWTFEKVKQELNKKEIPFEEIEFTDTVVSARTGDTSLKGNYDPANAIKTIMVKSKNGIVAVILKGDAKIDSAKLKSLIGKWSILSREELAEKLGFEPGGVNPYLLDVQIFVDPKVLDLRTMSMGAGDITKGVNIEGRLLTTKIRDIKVEELGQN